MLLSEMVEKKMPVTTVFVPRVERERESVCMCVCVCEREREGEREHIYSQQ